MIRPRGSLLPLVAAAVLASAPAAAQGPPEPPGPYTVDLRYATIGISDGVTSLLPASATPPVPSRGHGFDVGAHVYAGRLGPSRLGFGATVMSVSGTAAGTPGSEVRLRTYSPQLSLNFGTADGWSYLSTGVGVTEIRIETTGEEAVRGESGSVLTVNAGAGARWFLRRHLAIGFDLRLHRVSATDAMAASMLFSLSAGISLR